MIPGKPSAIRRDAPDVRDQEYQAGTALEAVDLRGYLFDIEHQRASQSCSGFAASTIVEMLLRRFQPRRARELSPLFIWWNARNYAGDALRDEGVTSRMLVKALQKRGICSESLWSFDESRYLVRPPASAFRAARRLRIQSYQRCRSVEAVQSALSAGLPVLVGLGIREGFEGISGPLETHPGQFKAYRRRPFRIAHFMTIAGFRPDGAILVNSWGVEYHDRGCVLMPWKVLMADHWDMWVMTGLGTWMDAPVKTFRRLRQRAKPTRR